MADVEACYIDNDAVRRQFIDVFNDYLDTHARDASSSESEVE